MKSRSSLKLSQDEFGGASIYDNIYDFFPEIYKALSSTSYTVKTMKKDSDVLMIINIKNDLSYTGDGDESSKRLNFFN